jgi:hypothetical protein
MIHFQEHSNVSLQSLKGFYKDQLKRGGVLYFLNAVQMVPSSAENDGLLKRFSTSSLASLSISLNL